MKILLVCGSLEHGRNGVGDYTRRLAIELKRLGQQVRILALADVSPESRTLKQMIEFQSADGDSIECLRLSANLPWRRRAALAKEWLTNFPADWVSLQFVPFAYHPKGICLGLGRHFRHAVGRANVHIMFHELWLGLEEKPTAKHRVWGYIQKHAIRRLNRVLQPSFVTTHADPYQQALQRESIDASILPLFGNISPEKGNAWQDIFAPMVSTLATEDAERKRFYLAGVFGAVYPGWHLDRVVRVVAPLAEKTNTRLVIVFFGKSNLGEHAIEVMQKKAGAEALLLSLGERSETDVSRILNTLDLGLSTSPLYLIQKSGAYVAMREHGLPVLAVRDTPNRRFTPTRHYRGVYSCAEFEALQKMPDRYAGTSSAKDAAAHLLRQMEKTTQPKEAFAK